MVLMMNLLLGAKLPAHCCCWCCCWQVLDLSGSGVSERGLPSLQHLAGSLRVLKLRGCQVRGNSSSSSV
jgi:hypothetical protein